MKSVLLSLIPMILLNAPLIAPAGGGEITVVETPAENSGLKLFEFTGGTPIQFLDQLKKTFGGFGTGVTMEDETGGVLLPACKSFHGSAYEAACGFDHSRLLVGSSNGGYQLRFLPGGPGSGTDPSQSTPSGGSKPPIVAPEILRFEFPGGTAAELISALDTAFGTAIATIAPEFGNIRLPALNMRADDASQVIELVNSLSSNTAGAYGFWKLSTSDVYQSAESAAGAGALLVTPSYNDSNPPPAILARDKAMSGEARSIRALKKQVAALQSALDQANQSLRSVQEQLQKAASKNP